MSTHRDAKSIFYLKNILIKKKYLYLLYRTASIAVSLLFLFFLDEEKAFAILSFFITVEMLFSFEKTIRLLRSPNAALTNFFSRKSVVKDKRILLVFSIWGLSLFAFGFFYFLFSKAAPFFLCFLLTGILWILDWFFMFFFCPFSLILQNKCCNTCRIYHFNYAMLSTPALLLFHTSIVPAIFTLLTFSNLLLREIYLRKNGCGWIQTKKMDTYCCMSENCADCKLKKNEMK